MKTIKLKKSAFYGVIVFTTIILFSNNIFSQNQKQVSGCKHHEKIKSEKVAYLTRELDLSPEEAQKFWPIYNEFEKKRDALRSEKQEIFAKIEEPGIDYSKLVDQIINNDISEAELKKDFFKKCKSTLNAEKTMKLYIAERGFKQQLLKQMKKSGAKCNNVEE